MKDSIDPVADELIVWAERYAIGRSSYANGTTAELTAKLIQQGKLSPKTLGVLRRDIHEALENDRVPYPDQRKKWIAVSDLAARRLEATS